MACKNLDSCTFLSELSSSTQIACSMVMATYCDNNSFSCKGRRSTKEMDEDDIPVYQWPINKMEAMELIMDRRKGISITG